MSIFIRFCIASGIIGHFGLFSLPYVNSVRIAMLSPTLPTQSQSLAQAANALYADVMAAFERYDQSTAIQLP